MFILVVIIVTRISLILVVVVVLVVAIVSILTTLLLELIWLNVHIILWSIILARNLILLLGLSLLVVGLLLEYHLRRIALEVYRIIKLVLIHIERRIGNLNILFLNKILLF